MNIQEAKELFWEMGCSTGRMLMEDKEKYNEYKALNIDSETERKWTQEQFDKYTRSLKNGRFEDDYLWVPLDNMVARIRYIDTEENHRKILAAAEYLLHHLSKSKWVLAAESFNEVARLDIRSNIIVESYNRHGPELAREYLDYARTFSQYIEGEGMDKERCLRSQKQCDDIEVLLWGEVR